MKKKYFKFILFITLILLVGIYISVKHYIRINEETKIIPISRSNYYDLERNKYHEYYIIVNPPKNAHELKTLIKLTLKDTF